MQVPSEVSAVAGDAAVLPCTFTHPHRHYDGPLTAIWRAGEPYAGPQVFRCAAARGSELCQTALSLQGRFRLLGNPRHNDLSLRVERLALADDGRYFCRIEFSGDVHDRYESRHGVWLRVSGEAGGRPGPHGGKWFSPSQSGCAVHAAATGTQQDLSPLIHPRGSQNLVDKGDLGTCQKCKIFFAERIEVGPREYAM